MDWSSDVCSSDLKASVWYYFREKDFASVRSLFETGNEIADAAAQATGTTVKRRLLGYAAPNFGNKPMAEAAFANIQAVGMPQWSAARSEEHTSELQSLMRISYAVFCLKKKKKHTQHKQHHAN